MSCNEWREYKLSELMEIINGGTPKTSKEEYWNGEIPWITVKDFNSNNKKVYKTEKSITLLGLQNSSTKLLNKGDLIISARGTVGALAMLGKPMAFNQSCYGLRANNLTTNDFLYYLLKHRLKYIKQNTHGSVFETITRNTFDILKIILPPLNEQKAIAKILSDLDEKIEINNRINKVLEEIAQTIFKRWFVDFEFPNENGEPYKSSGGEMVESELDPIPKGWEVGRLGNSKISRILKTGIEEFKNKKIYIATADVEGTKIKNRSTLITYDIRPSRANMQPKVGTIWFAKMKDSRKLIVVDDFSKDILNNYVFSTGFAGIECFNNSLYYLWCLICNDNFETIKNSLCNGTTMQAINNENIDKINILIPNENTLLIFNNIMKPIYKMIYQFDMQNNYLSQLRDTLLPKLMSGEIRVDLNNGQVILKNNED